MEGHRAGAEAVRRVTTAAAEMGIEYLTLYAFSVENWRRPKKEIQGLMRYLKDYLRKELPVMQKNNIKLRAIGRIEDFSGSVRAILSRTIEATSGNSGMTLVLALSYGGRAEIVDATRRILEEGLEGKLRPADIDEGVFSSYLYADDIPDPDLLIRTSGEMRVSNFLLWEISYAEMYVTDVLWPDFDRECLQAALEEYRTRHRRFGAL